MKQGRVECVVALCGALFLAAGCGSTSSGSGQTGTGGSTGTSTGSGGAGTGGTGGTGTASKCLDASAFAASFSLVDTSFCAVEIHTADVPLGFLVPSWGSHGGPLVVTPDATGGGVTLTRWSVPADPMGKLTKQDTHVDAKIPDGAFAGAQAVDLPFFGWTAISWTGAFPDTAGQFLMLKGAAVDKTYAVNGAWAAAGLAASADGGRLLYTGLSPLGAPTTDTNAFYAADACGTPAPDLGAGTGCAASAPIAAWGDSSGPVAVDRAGNSFVIMTSFATSDQEARGFGAASVAKGSAATEGTKLFTIPGFGTSLAAITPTATDKGLLVFQPFDGTSSAAVDVIAQPYTADGAVAAVGAPTTFLKLPAQSPGVSFLVDEKDRLWVAAPGEKSTIYVVLTRVP